MKKFLGIKIVEADPITEFNFREDIKKEFGHLGEDRDGYRVCYEDGYVSWSPKDVFEKAYKEISMVDLGLIVDVNIQTGNWAFIKEMIVEPELKTYSGKEVDFRQAIDALKTGHKIARVGWNGKGLFVTLQVPDENSKMTKPYMYLTSPIGGTNQYGGEEKENRVPWIPSQTDILAEDWIIVN